MESLLINVTVSNHRVQHLYLFTDGCPEDRLVDNFDLRWHTQAFFGMFAPFSSERTFQKTLCEAANFSNLMEVFAPLKKWSKSKPNRRLQLMSTLKKFPPDSQPILNAVSYQEATLRKSYEKLMFSLNGAFGGRAIGFELKIDDRGKRRLRHSYVNCMTGFHILERSENQLLVLLATARSIVEQYLFYAKLARSAGYQGLQITVVSDTIAGDNDQSEAAKHLLHFMLDSSLFHDQNSHEQIRLIRSPISDTFSADLLVDNYAGFVNSLLTEPDSPLTKNSLAAPPNVLTSGWRILNPNVEEDAIFVPALSYLT